MGPFIVFFNTGALCDPRKKLLGQYEKPDKMNKIPNMQIN